MPPIRPLTAAEKMEVAVTAAHAIGVGSVLSIQDSIAPDGMRWRWMTFQPERWLKGRAPLAQLRIYFPQSSDFGHRQVSEWMHSQPVKCLVFARWVRDPAAPYWVLAENPSYPGEGILRVVDGDSAEVAASQTINRLTPEELARRSTLVVVGVATPTRSRVRAYGKQISYTAVSVDSVLVGSVSPGPLRVYGAFGQLAVTGPVLLMLQAGEQGAYEVVGTTAGVFAISGDVVQGLGQDIASVAIRIRGAGSSR
jgi:hypothetical protein